MKFDDYPHSEMLKELGFEVISEFQSIICSLDETPRTGVATEE